MENKSFHIVRMVAFILAHRHDYLYTQQQKKKNTYLSDEQTLKDNSFQFNMNFYGVVVVSFDVMQSSGFMLL